MRGSPGGRWQQRPPGWWPRGEEKGLCILKVESGGFVDRLYVGVRETDESRVSPGRLASGSGRVGLSSTEMGRMGKRGLQGRWGALLWPTDIQVQVGSERDKSGFDRRDPG